jgi:molybdate transport system permease protein
VSPWGPVLLSLKVASLATAATFVAGLFLARLFTSRRVPLRGFWEGLILMPMVLPPTIMGYILLLLLGKHGPIGVLLDKAGCPIVFTWVAAVVASAVVSLPLMFQSCKTALRGVDSQYENAARILGLGEWRIFLRVTLPLSARGIIAGVALSFARALGEFGATLMVAGNIPGRTQTIPLALYGAVEGGRDGEALVLLAFTTGLAFILVMIVGLCERKAFSSNAACHRGEGAGPAR